MEAQIYVADITCHNCSKVLRNVLESLPGVIRVVIKKPQKKLYIHFDPAQVTLNEIVETIGHNGYTPEILHVRKEPESL